MALHLLTAALVAAGSPLFSSGSHFPSGPHGDVRLSELVAVNDGELLDEDGDDSDWIEVHNSGSTPADITGWFLTDDPGDLQKWAFPTQVLSPGERIVVFASDKDRATAGSELHTNFKLSSSGEFLGLVRSDGLTVVSAYQTFPPQVAGQSYGLKEANPSEGYFEPPTPGAPNGNKFAALAAVTFSVPHGFQDAPLALELTHGDPLAFVRYTLDGGEPRAGTLYTGPIPITGTTLVRATAVRAGFATTRTVTATYLFVGDVLSQSAASAAADGFHADWIEEDGTNWDLGGARPGAWYGFDGTILGSYSAQELEQALRSIPSISLVMPEADWFGDGSLGEKPGIYANSERSGKAWDRAGSAEWIDPSGGPEFQINCGIAIQGGSSTGETLRNQLSIALKFRALFGPKKLRFRPFDSTQVDEFDYLVLDAGHQNAPNSPGSKQQKIHAQGLRDQLMSDLHRGMNGRSPNGTFVHLYLNGLYWGVYNLHERYDHRTAAAHEGGESEEWDWVKEGAVRHGNSNPWDHSTAPGAWDTAVEIAGSGLTPADTWQGQPAYDAFREWFDVSAYVDYLIGNYYGGNTDWPQNNWMGTSHSRLSGDPTDVNAGHQWRLHMWDAEAVLYWGGAETAVGDGFWDRTQLTSTWTGSIVYFYTFLRQNPEWRLTFADRAHSHLFHGPLFVDPAYSGAGTPYDPAQPERNHPAATYHRLTKTLWPAVVLEYARWGNYWHTPGFITPDDWQAERLRILDEYFPVRSNVLLAQLRNVKPQLYPDLDAPVFTPWGGFLGKSRPLAMSAPAGSTLYFTLDGSDPRLEGGSVSPGAQVYSGPFTLPGPITRVKARAFDGVEWSALESAAYSVGVRVVINELMASNTSTILDEAGQAEDWVELLNLHHLPADVTGWGLSDDPAEPGKWRFPAGTLLPPRSYTIVWLDDDPADGPLHASFKLDRKGESLVLTGPADTEDPVLDSTQFGPQFVDVSWGRMPNGRGRFQSLRRPTPGSENTYAPKPVK